MISKAAKNNCVECESDRQRLVNKAWEQFSNYLVANNYRLTQARRIVLEHIMQRHDHFRADEVAADLACGKERVSRATVYNTLSLMLRVGLVRSIRDKDVHTHYEAVNDKEDHAHMICDSCGKFIEFQKTSLKKSVKEYCRKKRFFPRAHSLVVYGLCSECSQNRNKD